MKNLNQFGGLVGAVFVLLVVLTGLGGLYTLGNYLGTIAYNPEKAATAEAGSKVGDEERARIEQVVENYLLENPEFMIRVAENMQRYQQNEAVRQRQRMVFAHAKEIFSNPYDAVWNEAGKIPVVEFFDYQCTYCKRVFSSMLKLKDDHPNVRVIFKEYPVLGPVSEFAAKAAIASKHQGKYFEFHDLLMGYGESLSEKVVMQLASEIGLDLQQLEKDMNRTETRAEIEQNLLLGSSLGVTGTPTFVIGDTIVPGAVPYRQITQLVEMAEQNCKVCE